MVQPGKFVRTLCAAFLGTAMGVTSVEADDIPGPQGREWLTIGGKTTTPIGHYEFCDEQPTECAFRAAAVFYPPLSDHNRSLLADVQYQVQTTVQPILDRDLYGVGEMWAYPDGQGDCEDYALEKRRQLIQRGWPESALMMAVVRQRNGEGHAILIARTTAGDYVLDNLIDHVVRWDQTDYRYLKVTSPLNNAQWRDVLPNPMHIAAATAAPSL